MHVILALAAYFIFSAAVGAMAAPTEAQKGTAYGWFYRFCQRLAANADRLAEARFGGLAAGVAEPAALVSATHERDTVIATTGGAQ